MERVFIGKSTIRVADSKRRMLTRTLHYQADPSERNARAVADAAVAFSNALQIDVCQISVDTRTPQAAIANRVWAIWNLQAEMAKVMLDWLPGDPQQHHDDLAELVCSTLGFGANRGRIDSE